MARRRQVRLYKGSDLSCCHTPATKILSGATLEFVRTSDVAVLNRETIDSVPSHTRAGGQTSLHAETSIPECQGHLQEPASMANLTVSLPFLRHVVPPLERHSPATIPLEIWSRWLCD